MLKQRLITACVLLAIVVAAVMAPGPWPMLVLLAAMAGCAGWEWLRLIPLRDSGATWLALLLLILLLALSVGLPDARPAPGVPADWAAALHQANWTRLFDRLVLPLAALFWVIFAPRILWRGEPGFFWQGARPIFLGGLVLLATWYALAWLFIRHGASALISLWALVWAADSVAYFAGRLWGRHKLAPRISPGKTREGALAGILAAVLWLFATAVWWPDSYGALLQQRLGWGGLLPAGLVLAVWSILGDLFESLLKRRAGVKDSSQLLPGHGGVYDRIDAVLPVAPLAVLLLSAG